MEEEVIEEYSSSLSDLTMNSKPLINMLTMLAEDNEQYASKIVHVIETHINQVEPPKKLPAMYLIDSILKNLPKSTYPNLFAHNIAATFCGVFEKVDEKTRQNLYKLRQTWNEIFPNRKLYTIDVRVNLIDPAWPITAKAPTEASIHVNPKFLAGKVKEEEVKPEVQSDVDEETLMRQQLIAKQQEHLKIQQQLLELELKETQAKLEQQKKINMDQKSLLDQASVSTASTTTSKSGPRDPRRDPRLQTRDPRLGAKSSTPPQGNKIGGQPSLPSTMAGPAQPVIVSSANNPMGMMMPAPFTGIPPMMPPNIIPRGPPPGMMINHPPQIFPPIMPMNRPPPIPGNMAPFPNIPGPNAENEPTIKPPLIDNKLSTNQSHGKESRKSANDHSSRNESESKGRESESNSRNRRDTRSSRSRESNKERREESRKGDCKDKKEVKDSKDKSKEEKPKDSKTSRRSSPRRDHSSRDSKGKKSRDETESKEKRRRDSDEDKRKPKESESDSNHIIRKDQNAKNEKMEEKRKEESKEVKSKRYSKEKSPTKKDRSRSPVTRTHNQNTSTKAREDKPLEAEKVEAKEDKVERRPALVDGYKIPKKEPVIDKDDRLAPHDAIDRKQASVLENTDPAPSKVLPRGNSKRDLREMEDNKNEDSKDIWNQSKKPKLEEEASKPNVVEDISDLFGCEDQDYRSMDIDQRHSAPQTPQTPNQKGWAQYKADRPSEFAYELEHQGKKDTDHRARMDTDHRSPLDMDHRRPQDMDLRHGMMAQSYNQRSTQELTQADLPHALSLENREAILREIEKKRKSGGLSYDQQQDLLRELSRLDIIQELQKKRDAMKSRSEFSPPKERTWPPHGNEPPKSGDWDSRMHGPGPRNPRDTHRPVVPWSHDSSRRDEDGRPHPRDGPHPRDRQHPRDGPLPRDGPPLRDGSFPRDVPPRDGHYSRDGPYPRDGPQSRDSREGPLFYREGPSQPRGGPSQGRSGPDGEPPFYRPDDRDVPFHREDGPYHRRDGRPPRDDPRNFPRFGSEREGGPPRHFRGAPGDGAPESWRDNRGDNDYRSPRADFDENSQDKWGHGHSPRDIDYNRRDQHKDHRGPPDGRSVVHGSPLKVNTDRVPSNKMGWRGPVLEDFERGGGRGRKRTPPPNENNNRHRNAPRDWDGPPEDWDYRKPNFRDGREGRYEGERGRFHGGRGGKGRGRGGRDHDRFNDRNLRHNRNSPSFDQSINQRHDEREQELTLRVMNHRNEGNPNHDPRWCNMSGMLGSEDSEEFVINNTPYAVKAGAPPRIVRFNQQPIELLADPNERCIKVNGQPVYNFGDYVRDVMIEGVSCKVFYHGSLRLLWIDGVLHELRLDAPPKIIKVKDIDHIIKIDGRDGMILLDNMELGKFGGESRFVFIDGNRCELRFDPPPRQILIDGNLCELKLDQKIPCVMINNVPHGIRFDGPPKAIWVNNEKYLVDMDKPKKIRVNNRPHFIAFGGPAHEVILDGKWFEVKFGGPPKIVNVGSRNIEIRLDGPSPDVKILDPITDESLMKPINNTGLGINAPIPGPSVPPLPIRQGGIPIGASGPGERPVMPAGSIPVRPMIPGPGPVPSGPMVGPGIPMRPVMTQVPPASRPQDGGIPSLMNINAVPTSNIMIAPEGAPPGVIMPPQPQQPIMSTVPMGPQGLPGVPVNTLPNLPGPLTNIMAPAQAAPAAGPVDVNALLQKLLATGLINKPEATPEAPKDGPQKDQIPEIKATKIEFVPDLLELKSDELKVQYKGVVQRMYCGIQCTTCGMRFTSEQTSRYREHLDWHYRQNQRDKQSSKILKNRSWFYSMDEWVDFEEIDESEERVRSQVFEQEKSTQSQSNPMFKVHVPEGQEFESCPAALGDDKCEICGDLFEQFFNDEEEVWHLKDAIKSDGKIYHPVCFEDAREGSILEVTPTPTPSKNSENNPLIMQIKKELGQLPQDTVIKYEENMIVKPKVKLELEPKSPTEDIETEKERQETDSIIKAVIKTEPGDKAPESSPGVDTTSDEVIVKGDKNEISSQVVEKEEETTKEGVNEAEDTTKVEDPASAAS